MKLRITEIFHSIQGESLSVGAPTVFIRLTGCPLRCTYCDTAYAFKGGKLINLSEILEVVKNYGAKYVTVTGGEPLAQPNCIELLKLLCDENYIVSLETSGALDISKVDPRVIKVMDIKTPSSNEVDKNLYENIDYLTSQDQIKFIIGREEDYDFSKSIIAKYSLDKICTLLFSPSHQKYELKVLAENILRDKLPVRMQVQLHKFIWGDVPGV